MPQISASEWGLKNLAPGTEISFKVKSVDGDNVELEECGPESEDMPDMEKMSEDEMQKMPLNKMEKALPKADREEY